MEIVLLKMECLSEVNPNKSFLRYRSVESSRGLGPRAPFGIEPVWKHHPWLLVKAATAPPRQWTKKIQSGRTVNFPGMAGGFPVEVEYGPNYGIPCSLRVLFGERYLMYLPDCPTLGNIYYLGTHIRWKIMCLFHGQDLLSLRMFDDFGTCLLQSLALINTCIYQVHKIKHSMHAVFTSTSTLNYPNVDKQTIHSVSCFYKQPHNSHNHTYVYIYIYTYLYTHYVICFLLLRLDIRHMKNIPTPHPPTVNTGDGGLWIATIGCQLQSSMA